MDSGVRGIVGLNNTQAAMEAVLQENNEVGARYDGDDIFSSSGGLVNGMKDLDGTMLLLPLLTPQGRCA